MGKPSARARATKLRRRPRSSSPVKSGRSPRAPTHAPSMEAIFGGNVLITPGAAPTSQGLHTRNASSLREDTINRGDLATGQGGPTHSMGGGDHTPTHHLARTTTWGTPAKKSYARKSSSSKKESVNKPPKTQRQTPT